jgi:hypothetical protein
MANQTPNAPVINTRTINDFRAKLTGGGARPNLFQVEVEFPDFALGEGASGAKEDLQFMCKAANLPASNINVIDIPFRGRNLKIAGDRTFDVWTITVINDVKFNIRNAFEKWMNAINQHDTGVGIISPTEYQKDARVLQLGRGVDGGGSGSIPPDSAKFPVLKMYKFHGIFPTNVSAIELSYDQADGIEEFTVDLQVQWWDAFRGDSGENMFATQENNS